MDEGASAVEEPEWIRLFKHKFRSFDSNDFSGRAPAQPVAEYDVKPGDYFAPYRFEGRRVSGCPCEEETSVGRDEREGSECEEPGLSRDLGESLEVGRNLGRDLRTWTEERTWAEGLVLPAELMGPWKEVLAKREFKDVAIEVVEDLWESYCMKVCLSQLGLSGSGSVAEAIDREFDWGLLWAALTNYVSVECSCANVLVRERIQKVLCLHLARHLLAYQQLAYEPLPRNKGWTDARVLILTPTRQHAKEWATTLAQLLQANQLTTRPIRNLERLLANFSALKPVEGGSAADGRSTADGSADEGEEEVVVDVEAEMGVELLNAGKPADYVDAFRGNNDDNFIFGITLDTQGALNMHCRPDRASVVIASPLGIVMNGFAPERRAPAGGPAPGGPAAAGGQAAAATQAPERNDWLSSIEIALVDRTLQLKEANMDHLVKVLQALNELPTRVPRPCDIRRLRSSHVRHDEDCSGYYRQTVFLGEFRDRFLQGLFNKTDKNYRGYLRLSRPTNPPTALPTGSAFTVFAMAAPDVYGLFQTHFVDSMHQRLSQAPTIIVVPTYLDYVQVKKMLKLGTTTDNFVSLHEETPERLVVKKRHALAQGTATILLVTERWWYFRRQSVKGGQHVVFVGAPSFPTILHEMLKDAAANGESHLCVVYWDAQTQADQMERLVGVRQLLALARQTNRLVPILQ